MESGKRKFVIEPYVGDEEIKYDRKSSKFVFRLRTESSSDSNVSYITNAEKQIPIINNESNCEANLENESSIVLCTSDSSLDAPLFEQQLDISPHSVIKKFKINSSTSSEIKPIFYQQPKDGYVKKRNNIVNYALSSKFLNVPYNSKIIESQSVKERPSNKEKSDNLYKEVISKANLESNNVAIKTVQNVAKSPPTVSPLRSETHEMNYPQSSIESIRAYKQLNKSDGKSEKKVNKTKKEGNTDLIVKEKVKQEEMRLKAENDRLSKLLQDMKSKVQEASEIQKYQKERLTLAKLKQNQEMLYYYIGFKDQTLLDFMVIKLVEYFSNFKKYSEVLIEDQLTMTLMKLRRNYSMHDLAFRFRVPVSEADCIVFNIILALHNIFYENELKIKQFPSTSFMQGKMPEQFKCFPNCRIILECVKVSCKDPKHEAEADVFTSTKFDPKVHFKGLLGISPTKHVIFASGLHESSESNASIFQKSGIVDKLETRDLIMADKSFEIEDYIPCDIDLNEPSFAHSSISVRQLKNLNSKARAFIGRTTMQHIRRFCILKHIPIFLNSIAVQVFQLCSALVNFQPTITGQNDILKES